MKFKTRLSLAFALVVILLFSTCVLIQDYLLRNSLREISSELQYSVLKKEGGEIDNRFAQTFAEMEGFAHTLAFQNLAEANSLNQTLSENREKFSAFKSIFILSSELEFLALSPPDRFESLPEAPYFEAFLTSDKRQVSAPFVDLRDNHPSVIMSVPIISQDGKVLGIFSGVLDLLAPNFLGSLIGQKIEHAGILEIATPDNLRIAKSTNLIFKELPPDIRTYVNALSSDDGRFEPETRAEEAALFSSVQLATNRWVLISVLPESDIFQPSNEWRKWALWVLLGAAFFALLLIKKMSDIVVQPLVALRKKIQLLRHSEPVTIDSGHDEIAEVEDQFDLLYRELVHARQESALLAEEFQSIFDASPIAFAFVQDDALVRCNQAFEKMFFCEEKSAAGLPIGKFLASPNDFIKYKKKFLGGMLRGKTARFECRLKDSNNEIFWVNIYARIIGRSKPSKGAVILIEDISERRQIEDERAENEARYREIFEGNSAIMLLIDYETGKVVTANPAACDYYGYSASEFSGRLIQSMGLLPPGIDVPKKLAELLKTKGGSFEICQRSLKGEWRWMEINASILTMRGKFHVFAIVHDVSLRKQAEAQLRLADKAIESCSEGIFITDHEKRIVSVNPAFTTITGFNKNQIIGQAANSLISTRHDDTFIDAFWSAIEETGSWSGEIWSHDKNGRIFPGWFTFNSMKNEGKKISHYVVVFNDITEKKFTEEQMRRQAEYDTLTNLPNRFLLNDRLSQTLLVSRREKRQMAVLFLDLDRFKIVNDTLGHDVGDKLLQAVALRITHCVRARDTVSRPGGDEFILILPELFDADEPTHVAEKLLAELAKPYLIDEHELSISVSIGISLYPKDGDDVETLMRNADIAMYYSKARGRNAFYYYRPEMSASATLGERENALENPEKTKR